MDLPTNSNGVERRSGKRVEYSFVITREDRLLQQYYRLREASFREELGISGFDGSEDAYDRQGTVLLAVGRGGAVLAGARIYGNHPGQGRRLPPESHRLRLRNYFPALELGQHPYCHWGRLVIHPAMRGVDFSRAFLGRLLACSQALGYRYAFVVTDRGRARFYRQLHRVLGYDYHLSDLEIPPDDGAFEGLEHWLSYAVLPSGDSAVERPAPAASGSFTRALAVVGGGESSLRLVVENS